MIDPLLHQLKTDDGYLDARKLPDGSYAAIGRLLYTTAIHTGCHPWGYVNRFCFDDHALAWQRFNELTSEDDEPAGCIARRPER